MKRFLSLFLSVLLLFSTVACTKIQDNAPTGNADDQNSEQTSKDYEEQKKLYDDIVAYYSALLTQKQNGEELTTPNTENRSQNEVVAYETIYGFIHDMKNAQSIENLGYGYKDFDKNGTPELVIMSKYTSICAIFTISENAPLLLETFCRTGGYFKFATKDRFFISKSTVDDNIEEAVFYTCHIEGDKMIYDSVFGQVYDQSEKKSLEYFQIKNGDRVSIGKNTYEELFREHKKTVDRGYQTTSKLLAPRVYLPLQDQPTGENLPVADFSSYAAIRETYSKIATCLDKFQSSKWERGEYDNLFAFPNDLSYEYYNRLLYAAYHSAYSHGYDEIDLNGDGKDELVLLVEDYRIKAIFTQKDGVPILLDAFALETCWLDDQGMIHVDNEQYYELEYNLYEFTKSGEYNLVYSILLADNGNRYLTKDGKTEMISFEKSLELYYDEYCRYSEPFEPNEETRNASDLTYTPLTSPSKDTITNAVSQTWVKYANLEKTTNKDFARSYTYMTFANVTDKQITVSLKYEFIYSYPDPNRDHYLLDDVTESNLKITARNENGVFVFDENGIKGRLEFGQGCLWFIIEDSTDWRFSVGNHFYEEYTPDD